MDNENIEFTPSYATEYVPIYKIVHKTCVDFRYRHTIPETIHVVQYDNSIPIVEVELREAGEPFELELTDCVNVRCFKPDTTFVYNPALGCSSDRKRVFVEITQQMTSAYGKARAIIEVTRGTEGVVGTASFTIEIDRNPVTEGAIESTNEFKTLLQYLDDAAMFANISKSWAIGDTGLRDGEDTNNSKYWSKYSESWTRGNTGIRDGEDTNNSEYWSKIAKSWTQGDTGLRTGEETNNSEYWAKYSRSYAKGDNEFRDGEETDNSEYFYKMSRSYAVGDGETREDEAHDNAKYYSEEAESSADDSKESAVRSESYAVGGTESREGENTDNSKYYSEIAKSYAVGNSGKRANENTDNSYYYANIARSASRSAANYFARIKEITNVLWFDYDGTLDDLGDEVYILSGLLTKAALDDACSNDIVSITFARESITEQGAQKASGTVTVKTTEFDDLIPSGLVFSTGSPNTVKDTDKTFISTSSANATAIEPVVPYYSGAKATGAAEIKTMNSLNSVASSLVGSTLKVQNNNLEYLITDAGSESSTFRGSKATGTIKYEYNIYYIYANTEEREAAYEYGNGIHSYDTIAKCDGSTYNITSRSSTLKAETKIKAGIKFDLRMNFSPHESSESVARQKFRSIIGNYIAVPYKGSFLWAYKIASFTAKTNQIEDSDIKLHFDSSYKVDYAYTTSYCLLAFAVLEGEFFNQTFNNYGYASSTSDPSGVSGITILDTALHTTGLDKKTYEGTCNVECSTIGSAGNISKGSYKGVTLENLDYGNNRCYCSASMTSDFSGGVDADPYPLTRTIQMEAANVGSSYNISNGTALSLINGPSIGTSQILSKVVSGGADTAPAEYQDQFRYIYQVPVQASGYGSPYNVNANEIRSMLYSSIEELHLDIDPYSTYVANAQSTSGGSEALTLIGTVGDCNIYEEPTGLLYVTNDAYINAPANMSGAFSNMNTLRAVYFGSLNTSSVTDMSSMFKNDVALDFIDFANINTKNVTTFESMFEGCSSLVDIPTFLLNTFVATTFKKMFAGCTSLEEMAGSDFITNLVTNMSYMFYNCTNLQTVDIDKFDTTVVTDISHIFEGCTHLKELDLSGWNLTELRLAERALYNMPNLETIYTPTNLKVDILLPDTFYATTTIAGVCDRGQRFDYLPQRLGVSIELKSSLADVDPNRFEASGTVYYGAAINITPNIVI